MGLLTNGTPLSWAETVEHLEYIKKHGIDQFIALYHRVKGRERDQLRWGDEIEYTIVKFDDEHKKVRVSLRAKDLLDELMAVEEMNNLLGKENHSLWRPEFAAYMIEGTPGTPYSLQGPGGVMSSCFSMVEYNMQMRHAVASALLEPNESLLSLSFPALGTYDFTDPPTKPTPTDPNCVGGSLFYPDEAIFQGHPRFRNLVRNIRGRRGEKVAINVPIYRDQNTPSPFVETFDDIDAQRNSLPDHIYMDHMGFGMGLCCLQMTFEAVNVHEARWLYDQLTPITPIMVALSAATPIFRSYLSDLDSRWDIISRSVDDRTKRERGLQEEETCSSDTYSKFKSIPKSRYDSTDCYIYQCSIPYNDLPLQYDQAYYEQLINGGVDEHLARHIAHMFIRDPLQVYYERIKQDDQHSTEHFETIQSSNWMNMRFKPPPPDEQEIGWRVEFRPTEVQLTPFENAAYCCFLFLLTRVIASYHLTFLSRISLVTENMKRATRRDAVLKEKFHFRSKLSNCQHTTEGKPSIEGRPPDDKNPFPCEPDPDYNTVEMTIDEIVNGCNGSTEFPGLVPLIRRFLDAADVDVDTRCTIDQYLLFIQKRASGEILTTARWMRDFVSAHKAYKQDSYVCDEIIYDLLKKMDAISRRKKHCEKLLGCYKSQMNRQIPKAVIRAEEELTRWINKRHEQKQTAEEIAEKLAQQLNGGPNADSKDI